MEIVEALVYNLGYKKDTPVIRKNGRKASGQDLCAWLGTQGNGKPLRWTLTLRRKWFEPQTSHPCSGLLGRGDKPGPLASGRTAGAERGAGEGWAALLRDAQGWLAPNSAYLPEPPAHPVLEGQMPGPAHSKPQPGSGPKAART